MHSFIIQVSSKPIANEARLVEDNISEVDFYSFGIDYVEATEEDAIDILLRYGLPEGFSINRKSRTIEYNGSRAFTYEYKRRVARAHDELQNSYDIVMPAYKLKRVLDKCFFGDIIFCRGDIAFSCLYPMDFISDMVHEKRLYIGGCLDYHS